MNLPNESKLNYSVVIEHPSDGQWTAMVLGWWECRSTGKTREEAIENLKKVISDRLSNSEIIQIEIDNPAYKNPWLKIAGKYKDDPYFDEMLDYIAAYRQELDAENQEESIA